MAKWDLLRGKNNGDVERMGEMGMVKRKPTEQKFVLNESHAMDMRREDPVKILILTNFYQDSTNIRQKRKLEIYQDHIHEDY